MPPHFPLCGTHRIHKRESFANTVFGFKDILVDCGRPMVPNIGSMGFHPEDKVHWISNLVESIVASFLKTFSKDLALDISVKIYPMYPRD